MEERAAHRAPCHPVARRVKRLSSAAVAAALFGLPLVAAAPAEASASNQWPLQDLKASQVWDITKGSGAIVAVLDTGVAALPDTQPNLLPGADFGGSTTSTGNGQTDDDGHGTAMATVIAGTGSSVAEGLAPAAKILPVTINDTALGNQPDQMAAGIEYAASQHVSVISISQSVSNDPSVAKAIEDALNDNIVVVAAAGNETSSSVDYPAAYSGVIAVGAVDQTNTIWSNSNTGPQVTLAAPGVNVPTEDNTGVAAATTGTSAATAYVSATVALIRADHPSWTEGQVIRDLIATADPEAGQSAGQHNDQYGYGIVDPLKALEASAPTQTSNPLLGSSTGGSATSAAPSTGATAGTSTAAPPSSSSHTGVIVGIAVAAVVVILIIVLIVALNRRNRNNRGGGPGGPGTPGGPGGGGGGYGWPQQPPHQGGNPYQQQNPYQPNPYQPQPQPPQQYRPQQQQNPYPPQQQQQP